ncbi:hypothetical protein ULMS_09700 [Patiriisocius marinistellae]|uniref:Secreted protein n=1 Tax=Patiriisocius marinistellae TaxID=2494560 RepID=A0A5J4FWB9_9FLAO|nr:hypothetical protein [Patiriisocius marinistellae]GEQ85462.1 hypothetical protein ULMS_09700 [Patiriisocius marinistellae]
MKRVIQKLIAFFMAAVVLMTTMSFTVDMHYCGDTLVDFSFVKQAKSCGMEKAQPAKSCENPMMSEKSCCSDQQIIVEGQDNLKQNFAQLSYEQQVFVASFTYAYINLFEGTQSTEVPFVDLSPPFIRQDLQVLHQTFLF